MAKDGNSEDGIFFEVSGTLMKSFEDSFQDKRDKNKQVQFYGCVVGWIGGKQQISLTREAFENLPQPGSTVTIEGTVNNYEGKLKLKGEAVADAVPNLVHSARRPAKAAA